MTWERAVSAMSYGRSRYSLYLDRATPRQEQCRMPLLSGLDGWEIALGALG